jgi:ABC-type phosphate/phosphonate transport system substrate-binding protein
MRYLRQGLLMLLFALATSAAHADEPPPIAIGFYMPLIRDVPRKDVEVTLRYWVEELTKPFNLTYRPVRLYDSMDELKRDMQADKINFMVASAMAVAQHFSNEELAGGFSGVKSTPENLLLVVRRAAGIRTLPDLTGKRVLVLDQDELSEVYLKTLLMKASLSPNRLAAIKKEKRSNSLVLQLFFNQGDAALINRNAFEIARTMNPQIGERLEVLEAYTFEARASGTGLFSARISPEHRDFITQAALKIGTTARGRQLLDIYQADAMVKTDVSDLNPYRELLDAYAKLADKAGGSRQ